MNLDPLSFALSEISYTVANLTKKNYKQSVAVINQLVNQHRAEADRHLFRCLFSHIDFSGDGKNIGKDAYQIQFLSQEFGFLLNKPNFVSILCYSIDNPLQQQNSLKPSANLFPQISRILRLSRIQEVAVALALLSSSKPDVARFALEFAKQKIPELIKSYVDVDTGRTEGGIEDSILHRLLSHLISEREQLGISQETLDNFFKTVKRDIPCSAIVSPFIYPNLEDIPGKKLRDLETVKKTMTDINVAELLLESGYNCTVSVDECRTLLAQCGAREITAEAVARTLGMMARTPQGLGGHVSLPSDRPDVPGVATWNVDVFLQVVKEMNPNLNWRNVIFHFDHKGFLVSGKKGLRLLVQAFMLSGLQNDAFPIDLIYRQWNHSEAQLSFLANALKHPDVFCLADHKGESPTVDIDKLKSAPNEDDREIAVWKCLNLVEALLRLADGSHYAHVQELFKAPVAKCPDVLVLALLQSSAEWSGLKQELMTTLIPIFLGQHTNSAVILHYAWHHQGQQSNIRILIMNSMAEWYMRGEPHDQARLSRILDVAQELKALNMLLKATPYAFVIDLACLASRREYLKLDMWLNDKITQHKEAFIQACVTFLKRRCPQVMGLPVPEEPLQTRSQLLPPETVVTMLNRLKMWITHLSPDLVETINTMCENATLYLDRMRPQQSLTKLWGRPPMEHHPRPQLEPLANIGGVLNQPGPGPVGPPGSGVPGNGPALPQQSMAGSSIAPGGAGVSGAQSLPQSMASLSLGPPVAPGSPSKAFPPMSQQQQPGSFNPIMGGINIGPGPSAPSAVQASGAPGPRPPVSMAPPIGLNTNTAPKTGLQDRLGNRPAPGNHDMSNIFPEMTQTFSKEVEDRANAYFEQIYNQHPNPTMSIDEVLAMLKSFKDSHDKFKRDVFACMLRNLFEEYRFFPEYPERELQITAQLFGGIIEQNIVTYWTLGIALRYILEALRKPPNTNMYHFGVASLERFKTRLKEYPQYCLHLAQIPHFNQIPSHLVEFVDYGSRSEEPPHPQMPIGMLNDMTGRPMTPVSSFGSFTRPMLGLDNNNQGSSGVPPPPPAVAIGPPSLQIQPPATTSASATPTPTNANVRPTFPKPSIATATNIDTLLAGQGNSDVMVPSEALQDKVFFIFNNLSQMNMVQKAEELKNITGNEYVSWVAQYLVMKRASIEPNFHTLYSNFVDALGIESLTSKVVTETFRNIKVLLRSDKGVANFSDRTLLKNLGHWLGMLTLGKNTPILTMDLNLKALVYEAYQKGNQELLYVVPFTAKVLESCSKSKIFCKPNPWTMSIMNVLAELHQENDLKLHLKFEIEVLCKTLNIDIAQELKPGKYLRDRTRLATLEHQLSPVKPASEELASEVVASGVPTAVPGNVVPPSNPLQGLPMPTSLPGMPQMPPNVPGLPPGGPMAVPPPAAPPPSVPAPSPALVTPPAPLPMEPKFSIHDINTSSLASFLKQHIIIADQLQITPALRNTVIAAIESTMQEFMVPLTERAIKVAVVTTEQIVKKDFALDHDEVRLRNSAQAMARSVCAGLALITSREPMVQQLQLTIQTALNNSLRGMPNQMKTIADTAQSLAIDNVEICANYIQKLAVERVGADIDKKLTQEYENRKLCRQDNRRYCDPVTLTYQAERIPEQIRLKVGAVTPQQLAVYDEFARNIPGFQTLTDMMLPSGARPPPLSAQESIPHLYEKIAAEIETHSQLITNPTPFVTSLTLLGQAVASARSSMDRGSAMQLVQKAVEGICEQFTLTITDSDNILRFRECHTLVLKAFAEHRSFGLLWVTKEVTKALMTIREESRYNVDMVEMLIRNHLVSIPQYDLYLASLMENGMNQIGINFVTQLMQRLCLEDKNHQGQQQVFTETDFPNSIEALTSMGRRQNETLPVLMDSLRSSNFSDPSNMLMDRVPGSVTSMMQTGITQAREFDDPQGLHEKTENLLREWVTMYHSPQAGRDSFKAFNAFVQQMHLQGILKTDDLITRFFRLCTEMCVDLCYRALKEINQTMTLIRTKCFHTLDAFVRLIALLVKHSGDNNTVTKINLLNKVLGIMAGVLLQDHEIRYTEFQQLPYHRIFIMLFIELNAPEQILETINFQVLTAFCHVFHILRPDKAPGFAYAWLELISQRVFIGRLLALTAQQKGWGFYAQLLVDLFKFLGPFLRNADLTKPMQLLYKGTLRVLLVLLHDFPEFLCDYHYAFCDVIPPNCIQMRNLILSAFPRTMRLPDPFKVNLVIENLPDINKAPRILTNTVSLIQPASFKKDLDSYLKTRSPITLLSELKSNLQANPQGSRYDIPLINALVLYVGTQAIPLLQTKGVSMSTIAPSSHMDIFQNLAVNLDTEGRYLFLTAIANQLRYPNSHTHYFSCTLLYLFRQANDQSIQEQITRVLLERLIVNRPHPWGLLITFIELIKNPNFKFWEHEFVRCAPEIEKLFENVARSCYQLKQQQQQPQQSAPPTVAREDGMTE